MPFDLEKGKEEYGNQLTQAEITEISKRTPEHRLFLILFGVN